MTKELATLLCGPIAERFGIPAGTMRITPSDICFEGDGLMTEQVKSALWLAHLLGQCGKRGWEAMIAPFRDWMTVRIECDNGPLGESVAPTTIEALANAMLAVPVESQP